MWWRSWAKDNQSKASFTCPDPSQRRITRTKGKRWMIGSIPNNLTWCVQPPNRGSQTKENSRKILLLTLALKCFINHRPINCPSIRSIPIGMSMQIPPIISTCINMDSLRHLAIVLFQGLPIAANQRSASRPREEQLKLKINKPNE